MPFDFGIGEIAIVLVIGLLVFGPKRLPEISRSIGSGMRDLQRGMRGDLDETPAPALAAAAAPIVETPPAPAPAPAPAAAPEAPAAPLE